MWHMLANRISKTPGQAEGKFRITYTEKCKIGDEEQGEAVEMLNMLRKGIGTEAGQRLESTGPFAHLEWLDPSLKAERTLQQDLEDIAWLAEHTKIRAKGWPEWKEGQPLLSAWRPIIAAYAEYAGMHYILRHSLALLPNTGEIDRFISILNRCRASKGPISMEEIEYLSIIVQDTPDQLDLEKFLARNPELTGYSYFRKRRADVGSGHKYPRRRKAGPADEAAAPVLGDGEDMDEDESGSEEGLE
eukprot:gene44072-50245_t